MALTSPFRQSGPQALSLSQQTNEYLRKNSSAGTSTVPLPLITSAESVELWMNYERHLLSCLRTGNDKAAHQCLERLISRFGATNERVMGLHGLYQEAVAKDEAALGKILQEYNEVLAENPVNVPVAKRRIALLRSLSRTSDTIDALIELIEYSATDIEAWAELSDLYFSQGLYSQAVFCLEEVLVQAPNAWNIHARLGEILLVSSTSKSESIEWNNLGEALRRFCRSIELCDDYLRGYYGLKMTSDKLLSSSLDEASKKQIASSTSDDLPLPPTDTVRRLNELATAKLAEMIRRSNEKGYDAAEVIAARALLDQATQPVTR